jgi:hypothetical protein
MPQESLNPEQRLIIDTITKTKGVASRHANIAAMGRDDY